MLYCKHCGMESADEEMCEWCGRERIRSTTTTSFDEGFLFPAARREDTTTEALVDFFIYWGALFIVGSCLIAWRYSSPYLLATVGGLFVVGALLAWFDAIPLFEDGMEEVGLPVMFMLVLLFPALLVFLGYIAYGLITRQTDRTVVWLLSAPFTALLILLVVTAATGPDTVPMGGFGSLRGVEFVGLAAVLLGWNASSWLRLQSR